MRAARAFDEWADSGKDRGMEERHWHTAKHALSRMPIEDGDRVLDLGCGSGYAARAMRSAGGAGRAYGIDASREMVSNAREYTDDPAVGFCRADFGHLPFATDSLDHCFSMEAFYYSPDPAATLRELRRVLQSGGTFYCAVNFWAENEYSHEWQDLVDAPMTLWSEREYREAFREAGLHVAGQDRIPDREVEIPPAGEFPTAEFETRADMVERYRELGTLLTVGVAP
jgi:ubiquinone/menaquinone biosynthesis C-methylase UbiE